MVNGVTLEKRAEAFAEEAHKGQFRKYTNLPYVSHPQAVRDIVKSVPHSENMLAAALLHDVAEDCHVPIEEIECVFGKPVAALVASLTEPKPATAINCSPPAPGLKPSSWPTSSTTSALSETTIRHSPSCT